LAKLLKVAGLVCMVISAACGGGGGGGPSCTQGQACTAPSACRTGVISCANGAAVCVDSGNQPDGTSCTSGGTCQSGTCKRTVSGAFQTIFWTDDGTKTTVAGAPTGFLDSDALTPAALLVSDASATGYAEFPLTLDAAKSFRVSGVLAGSYFLETGATRTMVEKCGGGTITIEVNVPILFELANSTPDLGSVSSARPDLALPRSANPTSVRLDITGMDAWASGDRIRLASSQALTNLSAFFSPAPAIGAMTFSGTAPWLGFGLPDATKNDVVFVYQRATTSMGTGANAASLHRATKYARLTNLTVVDGVTSSATVALGAAPQTGAVSADLRNAQFAAFAPSVNPDAVLTSFGLGVLAIPHSASYPDMPIDEVTGILSLEPSSPVDADYGTLAYGQFLDPFWKEVRTVSYAFRVGSVGSDPVIAVMRSDIPVSALTAGPIVPVVSPPKSPRVNGNDAFVTQAGVGLQPTIAWSPPALGAPTSYVVEIIPAGISSCNMNGQTVGVAAVIHSGTSFKVPPGVLKAELAYRATITARQAPWDTMDAGPFRTGTPLHSAQCVTSTFTP
jgi:hypothetical protein